MATASSNDFISNILAKPDKTTDDLNAIVDRWHDDLLKNEENLIRCAQQLDQKQQSLSETTESIVQAQDILSTIENNLDQFEASIQSLTKYNDDLEKNIDQLNQDSKNLLPSILANLKTEQDRSINYDLMESVDHKLNEIDKTMKQLYETLQIKTDNSIVKTLDELQTCVEDIDNIQDTIKQLKL